MTSELLSKLRSALRAKAYNADDRAFIVSQTRETDVILTQVGLGSALSGKKMTDIFAPLCEKFSLTVKHAGVDRLVLTPTTKKAVTR